ncbi:MAG: TonB-dependent receptor [Amphiplicatus sp.]
MRTRLWATASAFALLFNLGQSGKLAAQDAADAFRDVILVTGTKKASAENVQDVPLAVTAYGAAQLDALKVRALSDLSYSVPNVGLEDVGTTPGYANFSIRGLGINSSIPSIDPAVGVFVDGVYLGAPIGVVLDIFDLESVEILRGPQGILFGRNVTGGAVLINTKKPNLDEFEASFKGAGETGLRGTGGNYYAMGSVSAPLVENRLAVKISAYYNNDRGYFKRYLGGPNLVAGVLGPAGQSTVASSSPFTTVAQLQGLGFPVAVNQPDAFVRHGASETWMVRPSLRFAPTDAAEFLVRYEHGESDGDGPASQNHPGLIQPPFAGGQTPPPVPSANVFFSAPKDSFTFSINEPGFYSVEWDAVTAELNIDIPFGDGRITNVFGWRALETPTLGDIDATPLTLFNGASNTTLDQISNEIRYAGRFFDRVETTVGFYYYDDDKTYQENRTLLGGARRFSGGGVQESRNYGVFGQVEIELTERFALIGGGRWTNEKKEVEIFNFTFNQAPCSVVERTCLIVPVGSALYGRAYLAEERVWKNFTPKVGFRWAVNDEMNVYAHWTQGVRSGGYNLRNTSTAFPIAAFDEETVDSFEAGLKLQPASGAAILNAAFFYQEIDNMQREINLADPLAGVVQIIRNTADAHIFGYELEAKIFLTDNFIFTGDLGYLDGEYDTVLFDLNSDGVINETDATLDIPRLAKYAYGAGFLYSRGPASARFNWGHRDDNAYTDNNLGVLQGADILDASIAWNVNDHATISLYGRNLLDEVTHGGETQLPRHPLGGGSFAPLNKGRIVGAELQLSL